MGTISFSSGSRIITRTWITFGVSFRIISGKREMRLCLSLLLKIYSRKVPVVEKLPRNNTISIVIEMPLLKLT